MAVKFHTDGVELPEIDKKAISQWVKSVAGNYERSIGEINYIFCSDEKILEVNNQYLQHDYYTDIITFDYTTGHIISGDIYISLDTVTTNAEQFTTSYHDELLRVIIHGILHLCGLKDETEEEEKEMRRAEDEALVLLP